ncbi:MAG: efflux RND transporter periplasmic adaptor subunit [Gammaproteobacteria bacterium]|nr:efflux RND transporter periplasmic adaptor subunit [Gammaproteobacteria bacterium]
MKSRGIRCERCGHLVAAASLAVLTLVGCAEKSNTVAVATVAGNAPTVTVTRVIERPMAGSLVASGLLVPREEAAVTAEVGGYQVDKVLVEEGAEVSAGQELARLDPGLLLARINQAKAGVSQAVALAEQARAEADRVKNFDARGVMSIEQVAAREFQAKTAEAAVAVARAQLEDFLSQERRLVVRAPVAGIVLERMVRPGDVASLSQPMFTLARDSLVELDAEVPEDELAGIALDDKATVSLPSGDSAEGTVRLVSPRIDPLTKLGRVRVSLAPHPQLRVGGYARAVFNRTGKPVAAIEEKAVQWEASGPRLITIDANNLAHPVLVRTGVRDAGFVALEQGPPVGTRVALGSGVALLEGDRVNPVEPGQAAAAQEQAQ